MSLKLLCHAYTKSPSPCNRKSVPGRWGRQMLPSKPTSNRSTVAASGQRLELVVRTPDSSVVVAPTQDESTKFGQVVRLLAALEGLRKFLSHLLWIEPTLDSKWLRRKSIHPKLFSFSLIHFFGTVSGPLSLQRSLHLAL